MSQNHTDVSGSKNPMYDKHFIFCNDGVNEKRVPSIEDIPDGFVLGRKPGLGVNRHWFTDGVSNKFTYECPAGFYAGRIINRGNKNNDKHNNI